MSQDLLLPDPCNDRVCPAIAPIPQGYPSDSTVFPNDPRKPDWRFIASFLSKEGRLKKAHVMTIIAIVSDIFTQEPNVLPLSEPIVVAGDIHGQYYDLLRLFETGGDPAKVQYVFLGDYVDRGNFSIEVLVLLFSLKINYPNTFWLLRGNHECRSMSSYFNFRDECESKYDIYVYNAIMEAFDTLPIAAHINKKFLALHGGLSPHLKSIKDLEAIDRFCEPPDEGLYCDVLWSDPTDDSGPLGFSSNKSRGCAWHFGFDVTRVFLESNKLLSIIRGHEAQLEGYKMHKVNPKTKFPTVITIFSAANYCGVYHNKGAIIHFHDNTLNVLQFKAAPHPYYLPKFMDALTWSLPFFAEKVSEMLCNILTTDTPDAPLPPLPTIAAPLVFPGLTEEQRFNVVLAAKLATLIEKKGEEYEVHHTVEVAESRVHVKLRAVMHMLKIFKTLREEHETVMKLKGVCPGHKLAPGLVMQGKSALLSELEKFENAKSMDALNERRP